MEPGSLASTLAEISAKYAPIDIVLVAQSWELFLRGLGNTMILLAGSLTAAFLIAVPLSVLRSYRVAIISPIIAAYVYLFRGTPLLVQLYLLYYGAAQFDLIRQSVLWPILREAWWCAFISLAICTAAYLTEILRGAIEAVPDGEVQAARSCGMSRLMMLRRVVLPNAMRRALPAFSNEFIFSLHGTVVASTVTIVDVLGAARQFNNKYYLGLDGFVVAAAIYMTLVYVISRGFHHWEARWLRHLKHQ